MDLVDEIAALDGERPDEQERVAQSRPRRTAIAASCIGRLVVARIPTMISGTTTRGSGVPGGGQWAFSKRR